MRKIKIHEHKSAQKLLIIISVVGFLMMFLIPFSRARFWESTEDLLIMLIATISSVIIPIVVYVILRIICRTWYIVVNENGIFRIRKQKIVFSIKWENMFRVYADICFGLIIGPMYLYIEYTNEKGEKKLFATAMPLRTSRDIMNTFKEKLPKGDDE